MSSPNIILITTDHLRADVLGCHGDPVIRTPNIDALARRSVDFRECFVQNPVCQPSRAALMTGRYPRHTGVRHNGSRLAENEVTLVEHLKRHGYDTAVVGKHHIAQARFQGHIDHQVAGRCRRNWRERPDGDYRIAEADLNEFERYVRDRGFEYRTGFALPEFRARLGAVPSDLPDDCHIDAYVGMKACEYLRARAAEAPFFLWVGFYGPHHPYVPSGRFARMYEPAAVPGFQRAEGEYESKPPEYRIYRRFPGHKYHGFADASEQTFREMKAAYYGMVSQIDWQVGEILATLSETGLLENTVLVFTSDHGEFLGDHGIPAKAPFLLDCMLHVPLLVSASGSAPAESRELVEEVDVFPTLCALAEAPVPEWVQGRSLVPLMEGRPTDWESRDAVYAEMVDKTCVRTRQWKYIHYPGEGHGELYDLAADPHELENLYARRPEQVEAMRDLLFRILDATADRIHPRYQRFTGRDPLTGREFTHYLTW